MEPTDLSRRIFLASSAALLQAQPNDTIRVAFIGVGNRGSFLLKHMLKVPGVKVVAICDINPDTLKAAIGQAAAAGQSPDGDAGNRKGLGRKNNDGGGLVATVRVSQ